MKLIRTSLISLVLASNLLAGCSGGKPTVSPDPIPSPTMKPSPTMDPLVLTEDNITQLKELETISADWPLSIVWSPDAKWLALATPIGIQIIDSQGLVMLESVDLSTTLSGDLVGTWVEALAINPLGDLLASDASREMNNIILWDTTTMEVVRTLNGHFGGTRTIAFSPDGEHLASGGHDNAVRLWDVETGEELAAMVRHSDWVTTVDFSPDGKLLASAGYDGMIRIWSVPDGNMVQVIPSKSYMIEEVRFHPDGNRIIEGAQDGRIRLWGLDGELIFEVSPHRNLITDVVYDAEGKLLFFTSDDGNVGVIDLEKGIILTSLQLADIGAQSIAIDPEGINLAVGAMGSLSILGLISTADATEGVAAEATQVGIPGDVELARFTADIEGPFSALKPKIWEPSPYAGTEYDLPLDEDQILNQFVLNGLTEDQQTFLQNTGFIVLHTQEEQFHHIRNMVSGAYGQPYFLTTDVAFHALHLNFNDLLKEFEKGWAGPRMRLILDTTIEELLGYRSVLEGTALDPDLDLSITFLSVALELLDESAEIDSMVEDLVQAQIGQILADGGKQISVSIPGFEDDYSAYKPVGHYAGDPNLEAYFRAMTWLGRVNFAFENDESSRLPLLVTLALRRASLEDGHASDVWAEIHEVLTFLVGPSDDPGPLELAELMDEVYGSSPSPVDLTDDDLWHKFLSAKDQMPQPRINSLFVDWLEDAEAKVGWRFMGQRFTLDGYIFQNLMFDLIKDKPNGERRWLPTGPDVMAALGSEAALIQLRSMGEFEYPNYGEQMALLQEVAEAQTPSHWLARAYDAWLYSFLPVLQSKGEEYPGVMRTDAWQVREMNSCLGSWAELKHDTILYTKMPEGAGGGGPPCFSSPPPSYVEANPEAFYRMAYVADVIVDGFVDRGIVSEGEIEWCFPEGLAGLTGCMRELGERFRVLGDIAAKELRGEPLSDEDYYIIQSCLGEQECFALIDPYGEDGMEPLPIVAAVAGSIEGILEVGTGYVDRIFLVVPINDKFYVAQGGVFSYYELVQPRTERLTDEEWREKLSGPNPPSLPPWASEFIIPGGESTNVTGFYIGAAYYVRELGDGVKFRQEAGLESSFAGEMVAGDLVQIKEGPILKDDFVWWYFESCFSGEGGWAIQDGRWFSYFRK